MKEEDKILLQQIANHLIVNSSFLDDLGLYHGKMGLVLFFVHYARYAENKIYEDFAGELIDEIFEDIHAGITWNFENGIAGIGWGILHLFKYGFMNGTVAEVLEDVDQCIQEVNLLRLKDFSIERGLGGLLLYLNERIAIEKESIPFDETYMKDYRLALIQNGDWENFNLAYLIKQNPVQTSSKLSKTILGLQRGYAGYGLKLMWR